MIVPLASEDVYLDRYARPDKGWTDRDEPRWPVPYWYIDTGFTALLILLAIVDEGFGAVSVDIQPVCVIVHRSVVCEPFWAGPGSDMHDRAYYVLPAD